MTPFERLEAMERRRDAFEAVVQTVVLVVLVGLVWWLS